MNLKTVNKELAADTTLSHYRIVSKIGAGGMGEVYLAQDTRLDRKVALKILPADLATNKDRMRRFEQEAKSAAALNHPNIAHIYEIGESDVRGSSPAVKEGSIHFIAMEFIDGVTLREKIHQERTDLRKLLRFLQHAAEGLAKAHAAGIVHRDLKPDNIMITRDGHAKILDFGLAKLIEQQPVTDGDSSEVATALMPQHSTPGTVMGTVGYMSPEQAQGKTKEIDQRSDIFSFGCILYEAVTGKKPFEGDSFVKSLHMVIYESAPSLAELNPSAPPDLQRVVRRCLAKDPDERYQTIKDVAIELKELRRELQGAGIDTTLTPPGRSETTTSTGGEATSRQSLSPTTDTPSLSIRASSAEYVVTGIKQHKLAIAISLLVLVAGMAAFALYLRARNSNAAINSIAVMPFVNASGNADLDYLSDGMTETLIKSLSQLPNLAVKSRSTVFSYKGKETSAKKIGEELGVQAVLLGRVGGRGNDLKLSLELVNAQTQNVIWAEQYDRRQSDLVSLQSEIARDLSTKLKSQLSGADVAKVTKSQTTDPEAYQAYLKGRYYWNRRTPETLKKAIEQFKDATDRDPNYAMAYVGLAECYVILSEYSGTPLGETLPQAKVYAERAIAIDDQLAEPHATLGVLNEYLWNWEESERELRRAIELNPNYATAFQWYSDHLRNTGRFDESAVMIKRAHEIDPLSSVIARQISIIYQIQNHHQASIDNSLKIIDLDPNFSPAYQYLGLSYLRLGRNAEGIAALEKAAQLSNRAGVQLGDLGYGYAVTGKHSQAMAIVKELEEKYVKNQANPQNIAAAYAGLGDKDKAFEWLEMAFRTKGDLSYLQWAIPFESLRDDPRYKDLLKRMGLPA